jgi:hypothetical protein
MDSHLKHKQDETKGKLDVHTGLIVLPNEYLYARTPMCPISFKYKPMQQKGNWKNFLERHNLRVDNNKG